MLSVSTKQFVSRTVALLSGALIIAAAALYQLANAGQMSLHRRSQVIFFEMQNKNGVMTFKFNEALVVNSFVDCVIRPQTTFAKYKRDLMTAEDSMQHWDSGYNVSSERNNQEVAELAETIINRIHRIPNVNLSKIYSVTGTTSQFARMDLLALREELPDVNLADLNQKIREACTIPTTAK